MRKAVQAASLDNVGSMGATLLGIALTAAYPGTAEAPRPPEPAAPRGTASR